MLRAFEQEMGVNVIRPSIAGLMGAFGAALYGRAHARKESTLLSAQALETFTQQAKSVKCGLCGNHCQLTVNTFPGGRRFISGNRCDRPITHRTGDDPLNLYAQAFAAGAVRRGHRHARHCGHAHVPQLLRAVPLLAYAVHKAGLPGAPQRIFHPCHLSGRAGNHPSDTVCYPAKLAHGHVKELAEMPDIDAIFTPA